MQQSWEALMFRWYKYSISITPHMYVWITDCSWQLKPHQTLVNQLTMHVKILYYKHIFSAKISLAVFSFTTKRNDNIEAYINYINMLAGSFSYETVWCYFEIPQQCKTEIIIAWSWWSFQDLTTHITSTLFSKEKKKSLKIRVGWFLLIQDYDLLTAGKKIISNYSTNTW